MESSSISDYLLLLFDRPQEPCFTPKGVGGIIFDVPQNYLAPLYRPLSQTLFSVFGGQAQKKVTLKKIDLPDLTQIMELTRHSNFSLFIPKHRKLAGDLITIMLNMEDPEDLISCAVYIRDRINPYLFNYCFTVVLLHRKDTQNLDLPSVVHSHPDKYVDSKVFVKAREEANIVPEGSRQPIEIPRDYTATDLEEEHRIAYFREDLGVNLHHWHWHLVYPFEGPREVVDKNRRGELFYYMHRQLLARYNAERFCNSMYRVARLNDWTKPLPEAYFPKLNSLVSSRSWPGRVANQVIQDLNREADDIRQDVDDLGRWRDRIFEAITSGYVQGENGERIKLTEDNGIDMIGNIIESSVLSPNRGYYGDFHNMGHVFISYIHDPDGRHLEQFGVIGDNATAMRDPLFYRWHAYVDSIFTTYKNLLPKYTVAQLDYPGVTVSKIEVRTKGKKPNVLSTFFQKSDVDLSRGMDFQPRGPVFVRFTHLNHEEFTYKITVNNAKGARKGTCRIFIAPTVDERGNDWLFRDQRDFFIEMDKFTVNLKPGENIVTRNSIDSSITIPFERVFRDVDTNRPSGGEALAQFNFCGCGWPHHMLVPKGTAEGYKFHMFVMISNYVDDRINQTTEGVCNDADSFCGIKDKLYPDRRHMGYPFDRLPRTGVDTLQQFLTPNMKVENIKIVLDPAEPRVRPRPKPATNSSGSSGIIGNVTNAVAAVKIPSILPGLF